jgi:C4-dicarboxylate-binding protein DctP
LLGALLLPLHADAQQVKLRANLQGPISNPFYGVSMSRFKEEVESRSGGAIAIEIFDKSQLFRDEQVVDAVAAGAVDIGTTASQQFARKVPGSRHPRPAFPLQFPRPGAGSREPRQRGQKADR